MRFPSLASLGQATRATFVRFPATLLSAIAAAALAIHLVGDSSPIEELVHLLMMAALGIPLFTALSLYAEKPLSSRRLERSWPLILAVLALLVVYWRLLGRDPGESRYIRY